MSSMSRIPLPAAAGTAEHVSLALANSVVTLPGGHREDDLASPLEATAWLVSQGLVPRETALLAYCQNQLAVLREGVRALFAAHVEGDVPPQGALDRINGALAKVPSAPLLRHDRDARFYRASEHPVTQLVEHAMARIAEDAATLLTNGEAARLARCEATPCDRFFLRTHARRQWCSTRCGDRVRAARAYARKRNQLPTA